MPTTPEPFDPNRVVPAMIVALQAFAENQSRVRAQMEGVAASLQQVADAVMTPEFTASVQSAVQMQQQMARSVSLAFAPLIENQAKIVQSSAIALTTLSEAVNALNVNIPPSLAAMTALSEQVVRVVTPTVQTLIEAFSRYDWAALADRLAAIIPSNWSSDVEYEAALAILNDGGVPLVWVPRAEVVVLIVNAADEESRRVVLASKASWILADVRTCLDSANAAPALADHVRFVREAVDVFESGNVAASQTLATAVLDSLVLAHIGSHGAVHKIVQPASDEVVASQFLRTAAMSPLLSAYQSYWAHRGDPVPTRYNRHATVHSGSALQLNAPNAITALMLVASMLRTVADFEADASRAA